MRQFLALSVLALALQLPGLADDLAPGTRISVRTNYPIEVARWDRGRIYQAVVDRDVYARDGDVAIPRGAPVELIVRQVGPDQLAVDIESVVVNGRRYVMDATGPQFDAHRGDYDNGGGLVGSIVGAIAGATGSQVETRGREIHVPAQSVISFQLQEPLHMVGWEDPGYQQNNWHYHHEHDWYR
jgi:hypothetical protein